VAVFAYSPSVEIYIKSIAQNTVYNVSKDIVRGQTIHRSNAPHQFQCTLMNKNRQYDTLFAPNDMFAIYMKRVRRLLVMSGYLDSVPWYSTWERSVEIFGTCTIKRLLQKRYDPSTTATFDLIGKVGNSTQQQNVDGGLQAKSMAVITQIGGWPMDTVHIGNLPLSWAHKIAGLYAAANPVLVSQLWDSSGGSVSTTGYNSPVVSSTTVPQGVPTKGPDAPTTSELNYYSLPSSALTVVKDDGQYDLFSSPPNHTQITHNYFCQLNWGYMDPTAPRGTRTKMRHWLADQTSPGTKGAAGWDPPHGSGPVMVFCPDTNSTVLCTPAGEGPGRYSANSPKIGLSEMALTTLGITTAMIAQGTLVYAFWCDQSLNHNHYPPGFWPITEVVKREKGRPPATIITHAAVTPAETASSSTTPDPGPYGPKTVSTTQGKSVVDFCQKVVAAHKGYPSQGQSVTGPDTYDCSGLAWSAWNAAGVQMNQVGAPVGSAGHENSWMQYDDSRMTQFHDDSKLQPGDLVFYFNPDDGQTTNPNHEGIYINTDAQGAKWTIQAHDVSEGITVSPLHGGLSITGFGRPEGYPGYNGKDTTTTTGSGSGGGGSGSGSGSGSGFGAGLGVSNDTSFLHFWEYFGQAPTPTSEVLQGIRGLLNDQPLLPFINIMLNASMRSWCSAPNGDFIAWFPDYFGGYNQAGILKVEDIELMDFSISWSDQNMVTHQYVAASWATSILGSSPAGTPQLSNMTDTDGVVTLEMGNVSNTILQTVLNLKKGDQSGLGSPQTILNRFGARPNFQQVGILLNNQAQFYYALFLFTLNWASMFTAQMPITFMPEAFPGMLVRLSDGFQAYITQVQHAWDYTEGGPGFTTQLAIMAPSDWKGGGLYGLPQGGAQAVV
jgi:hypothetical protein